MEKIKLKLFEFYTLHDEINGVIVKKEGTEEILSKGILREKLNIVTKFWLKDIGVKAENQKEIIEKFRTDLLMKYGNIDENNNISISSLMVDVNVKINEDEEPKMIPNPNYLAFINEWNTLLNEEQELEYHKLTLQDFEKLETEENYSTLFKLISIEDE